MFFLALTRERLFDRADLDLLLSPVMDEFGWHMKVTAVLDEQEMINLGVEV